MFKLCTLFKRNLCPQGHSNSFNCRTHTHIHTLSLPSQFKHRSAKLSLSCFWCIASHSSIIYQFIHSPFESHLANSFKDYVVNAIPATLSFLKLTVSPLWLCGWFLATVMTRMKSMRNTSVFLESHFPISPTTQMPLLLTQSSSWQRRLCGWSLGTLTTRTMSVEWPVSFLSHTARISPPYSPPPTTQMFVLMLTQSSSWQSSATPLLTQWLCGWSLGRLMVRT